MDEEGAESENTSEKSVKMKSIKSTEEEVILIQKKKLKWNNTSESSSDEILN